METQDARTFQSNEDLAWEIREADVFEEQRQYYLYLRGLGDYPLTSTRRENHQSKLDLLGESTGWICVYCARVGCRLLGPDGRIWHIDHFYPKALGGDDQDDNLVLSCATCNLKKGAKLAIEMLRVKR